jgi:hypothetical protein
MNWGERERGERETGTGDELELNKGVCCECTVLLSCESLYN